MSDVKDSIYVVSIDYTVEISFTVKNLCAYFRDRGYAVNLVTDSLIRSDFHIQGVSVFNLKCEKVAPQRFALINSWLEYRRNKKLSKSLRKLMAPDATILCIEAKSLFALNSAQVELGKVVYFFLENLQVVDSVTKGRALFETLVTKCKTLVIQSKERGKDVNDDLSVPLNYVYMPVSFRPEYSTQKVLPAKGEIKMIYSGYIAEWAMLLPFIESLQGLPCEMQWSLTIHGHAIGTEHYLDKLNNYVQVNGMGHKVNYDPTFIEDEGYAQYLSQYDVGVAFYGSGDNSSNWKNLIFSSGKIASYLWAGLGIITNIREDISEKAPFLLVEQFQTAVVEKIMGEFLKAPDTYYRTSREFAQLHYNFDTYALRLENNIKSG